MASFCRARGPFGHFCFLAGRLVEHAVGQYSPAPGWSGIHQVEGARGPNIGRDALQRHEGHRSGGFRGFSQFGVDDVHDSLPTSRRVNPCRDTLLNRCPG
jgi:hypothetical protein